MAGQAFRRFPAYMGSAVRNTFTTCIMDDTVSEQQALWIAAQQGALESHHRFCYVSYLMNDLFSRLQIFDKIPEDFVGRARKILDSIEYFGFGGLHPKRRNRVAKYLRKKASRVANGLLVLHKSVYDKDNPRMVAEYEAVSALLRIIGKPNTNMVSDVCAIYFECTCFGLGWSPAASFHIMYTILRGILTRAKVIKKPTLTNKIQSTMTEEIADRPAPYSNAHDLRGGKFWQSNDHSLPADRFLMQDGVHSDGVILRVIHNPTNQAEIGQTYIASQSVLDAGDDWTEISWDVINEVKAAAESEAAQQKSGE